MLFGCLFVSFFVVCFIGYFHFISGGGVTCDFDFTELPHLLLLQLSLMSLLSFCSHHCYHCCHCYRHCCRCCRCHVVVFVKASKFKMVLQSLCWSSLLTDCSVVSSCCVVDVVVVVVVVVVLRFQLKWTSIEQARLCTNNRMSAMIMGLRQQQEQHHHQP